MHGWCLEGGWLAWLSCMGCFVQLGFGSNVLSWRGERGIAARMYVHWEVSHERTGFVLGGRLYNILACSG